MDFDIPTSRDRQPRRGPATYALRQKAERLLTTVLGHGSLPDSVRRHAALIRQSGLFDLTWYVERYFQYRQQCRDPLGHYLSVGAYQGCRPNPMFDSAFYLDTYPDVRASGANPLLHYITAGAAEGRNPSALFETAYYAAQRSDQPHGKTWLADFIRRGAKERRSPHPLFDVAWYLAEYPDVADAGVNPLRHFIAFGAAEGRDPHPLFKTRWYVEQYRNELGPEVNPLEHFIRVGAEKGLKPNAHFDTKWYLEQYPDVQAANLNPLIHYVMHGQAEGRRTGPPLRASKVNRIRRSRRLPKLTTGVNLIGPIAYINGLGTSVRGYLSALQQAHVKINVVPWDLGFEHVAKIEAPTIPSCEPLSLNLVHLNLDLISQRQLVRASVLPRLMTTDRCNIAIIYWELASLRPEWFEVVAQFDEIWCASSFMARALGAATAKPVRIVRPALDVIAKQPPARQSQSSIPEGKFLFTYVLDANSGLGRKNPSAFVRAYVEEFEPGEGTVCLLKLSYGGNASGELQSIHSLADGRPDVIILDRILGSGEIADLFARTDCYVSPHRAEGLGLTIIEAMAAEKPVIATRYGGVSDFVTPQTSFIVDHKLVEIGPGNSPYPPTYVWADPVHASLRQAMRCAFSDPQAGRAKGRQGRLLVEELFSQARAGKAIEEELHRIWTCSDDNPPLHSGGE